MEQQFFYILVDKYLEGTASADEQKLVEGYFEVLSTGDLSGLTSEKKEALRQAIYHEIAAGIRQPVIRQLFNWKRVAVAASIILALGIGSWYFIFNKKNIPPTVAVNPPTDLPPGRDAAILTLADGSQILLDSASGAISKQNGVTIINLNGQLSYQQEEPDSKEPVYNTVTTARGNQYQLVLADGSNVWLNAASSLRFPAAFTGNDREVELTGEGYFEVAHNPAKPFKVKTDKQTVQVLGTHFNIHSYIDEDAVKTTLLEGSVRVSLPLTPSEGGGIGGSLLLKPGHQAILKATQQLTTSNDIDIEKIMAWKNGWFEFDQLDLGAIMRQVSRWYDVDIVFEGKLTAEKFGGRISKNLPLSAVMEMMRANGVDSRLKGKTLIVNP